MSKIQFVRVRTQRLDIPGLVEAAEGAVQINAIPAFSYTTHDPSAS